ncbi:hypothetical protein EE612_026027 [Oryza sativa]|nr:hypothetical protein EE612_026027 [Oryza sativa]
MDSLFEHIRRSALASPSTRKYSTVASQSQGGKENWRFAEKQRWRNLGICSKLQTDRGCRPQMHPFETLQNNTSNALECRGSREGRESGRVSVQHVRESCIFLRGAPWVAETGKGRRHCCHAMEVEGGEVHAGHKLDATRPCEKALDGSYSEYACKPRGFFSSLQRRRC